MNNNPKLTFLPPELYNNAMVVDEIDLGHEKAQPLSPFKGSRFVVYPNETSPLDVHDAKECWFIASGTGVVTYEGHLKEPVKAGDVLLFESQQSHKVFNNGTGNLVVFSVWWNN